MAQRPSRLVKRALNRPNGQLATTAWFKFDVDTVIPGERLQGMVQPTSGSIASIELRTTVSTLRSLGAKMYRRTPSAYSARCDVAGAVVFDRLDDSVDAILATIKIDLR